MWHNVGCKNQYKMFANTSSLLLNEQISKSVDRVWHMKMTRYLGRRYMVILSVGFLTLVCVCHFLLIASISRLKEYGISSDIGKSFQNHIL